MEIKITVRYQLNTMRMTNIYFKESTNLGNSMEKKKVLSFIPLVGMQTAPTPRGNSMELSQYIKNRSKI